MGGNHADDPRARALRGFDVSVPSPARMWNYWVGGKDNFAADREAAAKVQEAMPAMPAVARSVRRFLIDAVSTLAAEYGIRQFLDIGTGLPTADNTHEVAQRVDPTARVVFAVLPAGVPRAGLADGRLDARHRRRDRRLRGAMGDDDAGEHPA
jgi:S-adenosyl methyltransferase